MNDQQRGLFQHPEDDDGPRTLDLIRGVPVQTLSKTINMIAEVLAAELGIETPGGMVVIHELVAAEPENGLRCWQFQFGKDTDHQIMECAEECTQGVSNFLIDEGSELSSVQFGFDPGSIADHQGCKLALSAQGFKDSTANESLIVGLARVFQWIDDQLVTRINQLSNNKHTEQLLSSKFLSP